jgi:hypothetical protein
VKASPFFGINLPLLNSFVFRGIVFFFFPTIPSISVTDESFCYIIRLTPKKSCRVYCAPGIDSQIQTLSLIHNCHLAGQCSMKLLDETYKCLLLSPIKPKWRLIKLQSLRECQVSIWHSKLNFC